jgi:hypothetical protein
LGGNQVTEFHSTLRPVSDPKNEIFHVEISVFSQVTTVRAVKHTSHVHISVAFTLVVVPRFQFSEICTSKALGSNRSPGNLVSFCSFSGEMSRKCLAKISPFFDTLCFNIY